MEKLIKLYTFEADIYYGKKIKVKEVDVKETEKQYRTISGKGDVFYKTKINKYDTEVLLDFYKGYRLVTKIDDIKRFEEMILKHLKREEEALKQRLSNLEEKVDKVKFIFEQHKVTSEVSDNA